MSKKVIIINKELSLPINSFIDRTMSPDENHPEYGSMLTAEIDLKSEDFPFSLSSDIFIYCDKYYTGGSISSIQIVKDDETIYQTNRYDHLADINIQFDSQEELSCFLIFHEAEKIK